MNAQAPTRTFGTAADVARLLHVHPRTVLRHADELGAVRVGREIRFDLERLLDPNRPKEGTR